MTEIANPRSAESRVRRLLFLAVALGVVFGLVLGGLVLMARGSEASPTVRLANRVPADAHFYFELNTDLTSAPWRALPGLLERLDSEDDALDARDEAFSELGLDYADDVRPLLGDVSAIALAGWARSIDELDFVILIETSDAAAVRDLIDRAWQVNDPAAQRIDGDGDRYDLDVTTYDDGSDQPMVLTDRDGVIYVSTSLATIEDLLAAVEGGPTLDSSAEFERLLGEFSAEALAFAYFSGEALDLDDVDAASLFGVLDGVEDVEIDPRDVRIAFTMTATEDGFAADMLAYHPDGFGEAIGSARAPLDELAEAAPFATSIFYVGSGLDAALRETLDALEGDDSGLGQEALDELAAFEFELGLSLRDDLLPLLAGGYGLAVGASGESDLPVDFVAVFVESTDPATLQNELNGVASTLGLDAMGAEFGLNYVIEVDGGFVVIGGPREEVLAALAGSGSLSESDAYQRTVRLLPSNPAQLLFIDLAETAALGEELTGAPDAPPDVDLAALDGFGLAMVVDGDLIRVSVALPLAPGQ